MLVVWIVAAILGYILLGVIIGTAIKTILYEKDIVSDYGDAESFGVLCGILWPASPFFFVCLWVSRKVGSIFES